MHVIRIRPGALLATAAAILFVVAGIRWLGPVSPDSALVTATAPPPSVDVTVRMVDYRFEPSTVEVPAGARVRLRLMNEGGEIHEWGLEGQGWAVAEVRPGEQVTVVFNAPRPGVYEMACSRPGHYGRGMRGTLVVSQPRPQPQPRR